MKNLDFFNYYTLCLMCIFICLILPRNISLSFSKDLNQYNIDENLKILITKIRFLLIGCGFIIAQVCFDNFSIKTMIIPTIIIFCMTPKLFLKKKL